MADNEALTQELDDLDQALAELEQSLNEENEPSLSELLPKAVAIVAGLMNAYARHAGKVASDSDELLDVFKAFVKGDPSLNTVRDNVRELVYYQNCLAMGREDALPKSPQRMAVRTARHIYLYLRSRCEQEGRLD